MGSLTASLAVVITTVGLTPYDSVTSDRVDLIELNHFYDEHGKHVFDQVIFYDWSAEDSRYHVRAWRLLKKPAQIPTRNWSKGDYIAVWHDGEVLRRVRATSMRESWTQYDPELIEREFLAKEKRRDLARLAVRKTRKSR